MLRYNSLNLSASIDLNFVKVKGWEIITNNVLAAIT